MSAARTFHRLHLSDEAKGNLAIVLTAVAVTAVSILVLWIAQ